MHVLVLKLLVPNLIYRLTKLATESDHVYHNTCTVHVLYIISDCICTYMYTIRTLYGCIICLRSFLLSIDNTKIIMCVVVVS